jgi:hypothetical protein
MRGLLGDPNDAEELLRDAIALHQKHMDGTAPTTGPAGMRSQMEMMRLMKAALSAMKGKGVNALVRMAEGRHRGM